jgi:hypothetical protein
MKTPAERIDLTKTAAEAQTWLKAAEACGNLAAIRAALISYAYAYERESKAACSAAWKHYNVCAAAAAAAYANGSQDLEGGGDCWAVIKAEGAEASAQLADLEVEKAKAFKAAVKLNYGI